MSATYSQTDVAWGVNTAKAFYDAWPFNTGIDQAGFQSAYSEWDLGQLGQAAALMPGGMTNVQNAMASLASSYGMQEPPLSDLLQALATYAENNSLSYAVSSTLSDSAASAENAVVAVGNAVENLPSSLTSLSSLLSSPWLYVGIGGLALVMLLLVYSPEIKGAEKFLPKPKTNPKKKVGRKSKKEIFTYTVDLDERGIFKAHVDDEDEKEVYSISNENDEGVISEIEDGYMKHARDIHGLEEHLKNLGTIPPDGKLVKG